MSHHFDSGFMVRTPSWHRLEKAVLKESPPDWETARKEADLTWEVETAPVYRRVLGYQHHTCTPACDVPCDMPTDEYPVEHKEIPGWQELTRDDTGANLSIQATSYEVIRNAEFGALIDTLLGLQDGEYVDFEALMSLYGGRSIVALVTFPTPLKMPWDPSETYTYCAFQSRHDGNGGLRGIPTNVRVQCANTLNLAEMTDGKRVGFTIRHTSNWKERVEEVQRDLVAARGESAKWVEFAEQLALWKATPRRKDIYLQRLFPVSDDMGSRQAKNQLNNREAVRTVMASPTCEPLGETGYGLFMATTEWADHFRQWQTTNSYVSRQLLTKNEPKARAAKILRSMAKVG